MTPPNAPSSGLSSGFTHTFTRTDRSFVAQWWWNLDRVTLALTALMILCGVIFSFSSSPVASIKTGNLSPFHYTIRHAGFALMAMGLIVATSMLSLRGVKRVCLGLYGFSILVMALLPLLGHTAKGGRRWLELGFFSLQPSEFLKPALVVLISWMFAEGQKGRGVPGVTVAFCLYLLSLVLLLIQPDVGQSILITLAFGACFYISGVPVRWIVILSSLGVALLCVLFFIQPHFRDRILGFIDPMGDKFQVKKGLAAIAHGGFGGVGAGEGTLKRHIPDLHTDFIYSVISEEYGLWLILSLISVYGFIVMRGLAKAMAMQDPFRQIATCGLYIMLGVQVLINVSVNLGVIPPKGMTLPFLSYGGSSLMAMGVTMGLILALTRKRANETLAKDDPTAW